MSARLSALLVVSVLVGGCTPDAVADPPPTARASQQVAMLPDGGVPADRWRAVLIAGDNSSPAFDNGVAAMRNKLVQHGVRDIRVLTSDPRANPSIPVATAANVSSALRTPGGEACLAFITSHGDETGFVLKQANGTVGPGTLDSALDAGCGARPTVVVVSACHSGVFLGSGMRQANRIVLTAAAADRVSFGCGTGDQYTYFDQCLLQQFDRAATWSELAGATKSCVANLERDMGIRRPSLPQTFVGSGVTDLRIPGR
ncbi:MAG: hypothetical protein ISP49_00130 [Reyranella sp.]|nr:hypothetical protein [Reyranella sp.]MBL6649969.1 hypothetical protein [Reyranella sp.]